jgi:hypothetical protein
MLKAQNYGLKEREGAQEGHVSVTGAESEGTDVGYHHSFGALQLASFKAWNQVPSHDCC